MIDYSPFWKTLEEKGENWYTLKINHKLAPSTLQRIKDGGGITTKTINDLCRILDCQPNDIMKYVPSEDDQPL